MYKLKRVFSLFLCFILILGISVNNSNFNISAAAIVTAEITGDNVRVRTEPNTTTSTIIEKISYRTVDVLEMVENGSWLKITYNDGQQQITGYIFNDSSYVKIYTYDPDADFETKLLAFPESYRDALRILKSKYVNWEFIPDTVNISFNDAVALESNAMRKQVSFNSQPISWRSMGNGVYDWSKNEWVVTNGGWTGASREITAYYMDPRNFLNNNDIYQFLQQSFNANTQTEEGVKSIIKGTFMEKSYNDPNDTAYGGSYSRVIMAAAQIAQINPYILAAKIRQEIGVNETNMVSGTYPGFEGYYNFFNIGASGTDSYNVLINGLTRAKNENWNSRSAAIIGGAKTFSSGYVSAGQDTYYYQDFNVKNPDNVWHQYAQAIHDAFSKGSLVAKYYKDNAEYPLTFKIPVYPNLPESVSPKPESTSNRNNYYFSNISATGLTPTFSMFNNSYDLYLSGDSTVYVTPVAGATYAGQQSFQLQSGINTVQLKVKSETGYINDYTVNVNAAVPCVLTVATGTPPTPTVRKGDTNGDGSISLSDLANVRLHLLGKYTLSGDNAYGADTNGDGQISLSDLANIRLHLLGKFTIS